ncbi:MAG: DUF4139 domain-containing protein [Pseudarcicella sp.]|nr:DUF4139 domain-containing protein [Pseudarcicella sp.]
MKKILLLLLFSNVMLLAQKPIIIQSKLTAATVYINGAELTHDFEVNLPSGKSEIIVKNIANNINESTLRFQLPPNITILSSRFTKENLHENGTAENSVEIKKIKDSINIVTIELEKNKNYILVQQKTIAMLEANQNQAGANTNTIVTELVKLVDYYQTKRLELENNLYLAFKKEEMLNNKKNLLNAQLQNNASQDSKIAQGKLILLVNNESANLATFNVSYITPFATWKPNYDIKIDNIKEPLKLFYKANVSQQTGIDWKKIKLTLSSNTPNVKNEMPKLNSEHLQYDVVNVAATRFLPPANADMYASAPKEVVIKGYGVKRNKESTLDKYFAINDNDINISFDISIPYDVLSNGLDHLITMKELKIPATFKYLSIPRSKEEVILVAEVIDFGKYNLLNGQANLILENMFLGKIDLDLNQTDDTLELSFGSDKKLTVLKQKVSEKKAVKFMSSYKTEVFTYDLILRNNKKEPVVVTLKDQIPISDDKEIEVSLLESSGANPNTETGELAWEVNLSASESKKIRFSYSVKSLKDKTIQQIFD